MSAQPSLFSDTAAERARIAAAIAERFACYGRGTGPHNPGNPVANTLADQPPQFAFGVPVADVVDAVLELAGVLTLPASQKEKTHAR